MAESRARHVPSLLALACALALGLTGCVVAEERPGVGRDPHPAQLRAEQSLREERARSMQHVEAHGRRDEPVARAHVEPSSETEAWVDVRGEAVVPREHPEVRAAVDTRALDLLSPAKRLVRARRALRDDEPRIAIEALHAYLAAAPTDQAARVDLARAYLLDGRDELAHDVLVSLLGEDVTQHEVLTLLGHVYARAGQHGRAARLYEEAIATGGDRALLQPLLDRVGEQ